jgi:YD repeat-containing protein
VGYDAASRIGFISDIGNPANSNTYSYDSLDRLTNAVLPGTPFAYSYDAVGNRLSKTVGSSTDTYAYGATSNRLASITPGAGPLRNYVHDAAGSVTADGANTYAYDARGRLVQAVSLVGTSNYQINSLEQRIQEDQHPGRRSTTTTRKGGSSRRAVPAVTRARSIYLGDIPVAVIQ